MSLTLAPAAATSGMSDLPFLFNALEISILNSALDNRVLSLPKRLLYFTN